MIYKLCAKCQTVVIHPSRYCLDCSIKVELQKTENKKVNDKKYNRTRDNKYIVFYNSKAWKDLREKVLQDNQYQCIDCKKNKEQGELNKVKLAEEVHHEKPIQTEEGWELRYEYNGLSPLCNRHHNLRHNRFNKRKK